MAFAIKHHGGFTLKFVGDAVIGYFVHSSSLIAADNAVSCAKSMIKNHRRRNKPYSKSI